jgi:hypothetical protein
VSPEIEQRVVGSIGMVHSAGVIGSSWIAGPDTLVTNLHVARASTQDLFVRFSDGELVECYTAAAGDDIDLAAIKCETGDRAALTVRPERPDVGTPVLVAGYPEGVGPTVTRGEVAPGREVRGVDAIAFTAGIEPGSSGSPVVNEAGDVVAVATWLGGYGPSSSDIEAIISEAEGLPSTKAGAEWRLRGIRSAAFVALFLVVHLIRRWRRDERPRVAGLLKVVVAGAAVAFVLSQLQFMAAGPTTHF